MESFNSYEKMPDSLQKLKLDAHQMRQLDKLKWAVTEKVHGANFSFIFEDGNLSYAKRKEPLTWTDDFFGYQLLVEKIDIAIRKLFQIISQTWQFDRCTVYGELFGGEYPHPEVKPDHKVQAIQTGIYYSPSISFCGFDIALELKEKRNYLDYKLATKYFEDAGVFYAKPLLIGSFTEALNYDINFQSFIPSQLGLPALDQDNLTEGVVIKPMTNVVLNTAKGKMRPILKIKNDKFSEEKKFHESKKWSFLPEKPPTAEELAFILPDLQAFITANRLQNVLSKTGSLDATNTARREQVRTLFLEDVLESFEETCEGMVDLLDEKKLTWLKNRLLLDIDLMIQQHLH